MKKLITISILILTLGLMACSKEEKPSADNLNEEITKSEIGEWSDGLFNLTIRENEVVYSTLDGTQMIKISISQKISGKMAGPVYEVSDNIADAVPVGTWYYLEYEFDPTNPNKLLFDLAAGNYPSSDPETFMGLWPFERISGKGFVAKIGKQRPFLKTTK
jgi:hypothetical protein